MRRRVPEGIPAHEWAWLLHSIWKRSFVVAGLQEKLRTVAWGRTGETLCRIAVLDPGGALKSPENRGALRAAITQVADPAIAHLAESVLLDSWSHRR